MLGTKIVAIAAAARSPVHLVASRGPIILCKWFNVPFLEQIKDPGVRPKFFRDIKAALFQLHNTQRQNKKASLPKHELAARKVT